MSLIQISISRYSSDTLQTQLPFCHSFRFQFQDTVQIHSRRGSHSVTHSDFKIQSRYAPDTEAIMSLIQFHPTDTVQIHSRHKSHSVTYSDSRTNIVHIRSKYGHHFHAYSVDLQSNILGWHLQAHLQQDSNISPNGIFKPIPSTTLLPSANLWAL